MPVVQMSSEVLPLTAESYYFEIKRYVCHSFINTDNPATVTNIVLSFFPLHNWFNNSVKSMHVNLRVLTRIRSNPLSLR